MAEGGEDQGRIERLAGRAFLRTEHAIYVALGVLLALTAVATLVDAAGLTLEALRALGGTDRILEAVERLLFLLMIVEILHTVRVSMRSGRLTCEPFLVVGLIASIRRVLVITLQSSEFTHGAALTPEKEALFRAAMIELGVLAVLILVMVASIVLLRRAGDVDRPGDPEAPASTEPSSGAGSRR